MRFRLSLSRAFRRRRRQLRFRNSSATHAARPQTLLKRRAGGNADQGGGGAIGWAGCERGDPEYALGRAVSVCNVRHAQNVIQHSRARHAILATKGNVLSVAGRHVDACVRRDLQRMAPIAVGSAGAGSVAADSILGEPFRVPELCGRAGGSAPHRHLCRHQHRRWVLAGWSLDSRLRSAFSS